MLEDIYDVLVVLLEHAGRTGLGEAILNEAKSIIAKADPKIAAKLQAAQAAQAAAAKEYEEFLAYQSYKASQAGQAGGSVPAPQAPAAPVFPPVVSS